MCFGFSKEISEHIIWNTMHLHMQLTYTYVFLGSFVGCSALQLLFDTQWTSHLASFQPTWSIALLVTIEKNHCFISLIQLTHILLLTESQVAGKTHSASNKFIKASKCGIFPIFTHSVTQTKYQHTASLHVYYAMTVSHLIEASFTNCTCSFSVTFSSNNKEQFLKLLFYTLPTREREITFESWILAVSTLPHSPHL